MDEVLSAIVEELQRKHGCHTVILYGSRAHGEPEESSDYDVFGVRETGAAMRDARRFGDAFLDAAIHCEAELIPPTAELIRLRHGKVLVEKDGWGTRLVADARRLFEAGPKKLEPWEAELATSWAVKSLARVSRGEDFEASYRRVWLLTQLLEDYFRLRGLWYLGPKESIQWLRVNDARAAAVFERALAPEASRSALRGLVELVISR